MSTQPRSEKRLRSIAAIALASLAIAAPTRTADAGEPERAGPAAESSEETAPEQPATDDLQARRERFRDGLRAYAEGRVAEAIRFWLPVYRELGEREGYRVAYNLARAYERFGDVTQAAQHYESFVAEVERRRSTGESIDPLVQNEEDEARRRLRDIRAQKGRIVVSGTTTALSVQVDSAEPRLAPLSVYVTPGDHTVIFRPGSADAEKRLVHVERGQTIELAPREPRGTPAPDASRVETSPQAPTRWTTKTERPFSPAVLYIAGGITVASMVLPVAAYVSAMNYRSTHELSSDPAASAQNDNFEQGYSSRKSRYAVALAIPITLGAITGGLATWYFVGGKERNVPERAAHVRLTTRGAGLTIDGRF